MQKIKLLGIISALVLALAVFVNPAYAANISITQLPSYINSNTFKLSYSCLGCTSVQFSVSKHGGAWVAFGPAMTDASGQVQVTSSQVDEQTDYSFKVADAGIGEAVTSTTYDASGPSPVSGYSKERVNEGKYKLHWRNPNDSDFSQVIIYRGDTAGFSADNGHEIARVAGGADSDMTYDDSFAPDASKTYYYALRAIDKANNSSGLVGDGGTITATAGSQPAAAGAATGTKVVALPAEGQVLGGEATSGAEASPEPSTEAQEGVSGGLSGLSTKKKVVIGVALFLLGIVSYSLLKRRNQ